MFLPNMATYMNTDGSKINVFIYKINTQLTIAKSFNINIIKKLYIKSLFNMNDYSLSMSGIPIINNKCISNGIVKINNGDRILILCAFNKRKNFITYVKFDDIKKRKLQCEYIESIHISELNTNQECLLLNINSILSKINHEEIELYDIYNLNNIIKV